MKLHEKVDKKKIQSVMKEFVGEISQVPPLRSAVKRIRRKRTIYYIDILEIKDKEVLFRVGCESGTYVRTLCVDIGKKLKIRAHLADLRRTRVGKLLEEDSVILHDVKDSYVYFKEDKNEKNLRQILRPIEEMFESLPKIIIRDSAVDAICHGANLAIPGVVEVDSDISKGDFAVVFTKKGEAVALVNSLMSSKDIVDKDKGVCASLERVVMKKGTYPSIWKKS